MAVSIIVPPLGESIVEGTIVKWLKKEGEKVGKDEPVVEIMTDKINVELPAPEEGILVKILQDEGAVVPIGTHIAVLNGEGIADIISLAETAPAMEGKEEVLIPSLQPQTQVTAPAVTEAPAATSKKRSSPAVRRLAGEHGINIDDVPGTGGNGRVTKEDILKFIESRKGAPAPPTVSVPSTPVGESAATPLGEEEIIPFTAVRKMIADHMIRSKQTSAHYSTLDEADVTEIVNFVKENKKNVEEKYGVHLTYTPFIVKALVLALKDFPILNSSLDGDKLHLKKYYNIGIAVHRDEGLIVPVLKNADKKSLLEISREMKDLGERARTNKLNLDDVQGGTFTITNAGMFGTTAATPIISQPQVGILGVNQIREQPVVRDGKIVIRWMTTLSGTWDHRVVDGGLASQFLHRVVKYLENPLLWALFG
jgi:2-oxoglutarate dehydrogenase E2 component (dihydrolipoamide succinyltransferase)